MEGFLTSFWLVALAEMGDKTQLLSFMLAARFAHRHWSIICGIFVATLVNHFGAAAVGGWIAAQVGPTAMRWGLAAAFFAFALWALVPDKLEGTKQPIGVAGAFLTTTVAFFLAEMGDKTQLATIALGARFPSLAAVVMGTTLGMMAANVPAVLLGEKLAQKVPMSVLRMVAAALFAIFGLLILMDIDIGLNL